MIRIVLLGRTGNNLFQYAMGRALARKHGVPLMLEASGYNQNGWRDVSHFLRPGIKATVVRQWSLGVRALRKITGKHYLEFSRQPLFRENDKDHSFQPHLLDAPGDCVLFGYFQSWRYFSAIEDELREELICLLEAGAGMNEDRMLADPCSVAVHIRRGDFLHHPAFPVCDSDYYLKAMDTMRDRLDAPRFFLFSDDTEWCRREFTASDVTIVDSGKAAANPLHDLRLMSLASHHIIANSSYSWWAAWIGKKEHQIVFTPSRWFIKDIIAPMEDKLCPGWLALR